MYNGKTIITKITAEKTATPKDVVTEALKYIEENDNCHSHNSCEPEQCGSTECGPMEYGKKEQHAADDAGHMLSQVVRKHIDIGIMKNDPSEFDAAIKYIKEKKEEIFSESMDEEEEETDMDNNKENKENDEEEDYASKIFIKPGKLG